MLAGHIRRGDTEAIHAAIWLSDIRGFTTLADTLPPQDLVDLLNRYFDCQVPAIVMGDGLLAIFPIGAERDFSTICAAALEAGRAARDQIAALGASDGKGSGLRFGLALHVGDVQFGNIGSGNRLDFTCIGPAVNLAARLEKLAGRLGRNHPRFGGFRRSLRRRRLAIDRPLCRRRICRRANGVWPRG